ncbi:MAG: nuclear transport factor 2 family protein [Cyclobacteriaceae bacterium]
MKKLVLIASCLYFSIHIPILAQGVKDENTIKNLLVEFLEKVDSKEMHDRFWDETLVYTSSSGERFGKAKIMSGFESDSDAGSSSNSPYSATDIDIRISKNLAILNFKLVNKPVGSDSLKVTYYLNSGVLKKTKNTWKVINWQATKMAID